MKCHRLVLQYLECSACIYPALELSNRLAIQPVSTVVSCKRREAAILSTVQGWRHPLTQIAQAVKVAARVVAIRSLQYIRTTAVPRHQRLTALGAWLSRWWTHWTIIRDGDVLSHPDSTSGPHGHRGKEEVRIIGRVEER